ncbi:hypothetical protein RUM44_000987 [Polyplax serrata]|uniref:Ubiquitin carboxyl-terminal hydrolase n=1 Tax=Polyplax serrata TaxID=468196 RepID=A0ABR1B6H5_POLSC
MSGKENCAPLKFRNIEELKPHYDRLQLNGKNPRDLMQKLDMIYKKATEKLAAGDIENAYILLMKYLNVFSFIQKSDDYKKDSRYYKAMLGRQPKEAMELAENLNYNLRESYSMLQKTEQNVNKRPKDSLKSININIEMPDMRIKKESKSSVTSAKLFSMLREGTTKLLIMDIRPQTDFESSRIQDNMINIPSDIIFKGKSANMLAKELSETSQNLWNLRATYDQVVLLDWMTNEQNFNHSKLAVLKEILTEWDIDITYKNEILFLDGGYEDWLNSYPWNTTNPKIQRPLMEETVSEIILDQIIYPELDDINANVEQEFLKPFFDKTTKSFSEPIKGIDYDGSELVVEHASRPSFDRTKKAAAIKTYEERRSDLANLLNQKVKETSEALILERTMLDSEKELQETIDKQKEVSFDEEQRRILEEKEEKLLMRVEELKEESILKDNKIKELQKIIEIYEKKDIEEIAKKVTDHERQIREAEMNERIRLQEEEKIKIAKEREEIERNKLLERKRLEEKYRAKLEIARSKKKRLLENNTVNPTNIMPNDGCRIPVINRSNKPRLIEKVRQFNGVKGNVGRGLTGLKNLGNTCYMNSIVQCVSNNPALAKYFCGNHYRDDLFFQNKTKGEVAEEMAAVVKTLWSGQFRSIACRDFKSTVGAFKTEYATYEQQDSHEFLTFLMDWLHNDLNKVVVADSTNSKSKMNDMEKAWWDFKQKNESLISTLFYGLQKSTLTCVKCDEASVTYEPFSNLSLIIPDSECSSAEVLSRKRTSFVDFPLTDLNLSQYVSVENQKHINYDLYAISNHYGTMEGGHYTAFCKSPVYKRWYKFDDHEVFEIAPCEVKTSAAYILFYTSINCRIPEPSS